MFRQMRRNKQLLSEKEIQDVLKNNTNGVLGVHGENGYPYTVPLSFVYYNGKIYFHCAKSGHKIDAIEKNPKVSFTIVDEDTIVSEEYTTYFRSVILFGKAEIVKTQEERIQAFRALAQKYSGDLSEENRESTIQHCTQALIVGIDIEHITGKQSLEYAKHKE